MILAGFRAPSPAFYFHLFKLVGLDHLGPGRRFIGDELRRFSRPHYVRIGAAGFDLLDNLGIGLYGGDFARQLLGDCIRQTRRPHQPNQVLRVRLG